MSAETLSMLLHLAEACEGPDKDPLRLASQCGLEVEPDLCEFLWYLTDTGRQREHFVVACEAVYNNSRFKAFWRALAAHHRALAGDSNPDMYFAQAMMLIGPAWNYPKPDKKAQASMSDEDRQLIKAQSELVTPEGSYIYHLRLRDRARVLNLEHNLAMALLGAERAIHEGWFEAPAWTLDACNRLMGHLDHERQLKLLTLMEERVKTPHHFGQHELARLRFEKRLSRLRQPNGSSLAIDRALVGA